MRKKQNPYHKLSAQLRNPDRKRPHPDPRSLPARILQLLFFCCSMSGPRVHLVHDRAADTGQQKNRTRRSERRCVSPLRLAVAPRRCVSPLRLAAASRRCVSPLRLAAASRRRFSPSRPAVAPRRRVSPSRLVVVTSSRIPAGLLLRVACFLTQITALHAVKDAKDSMKDSNPQRIHRILQSFLYSEI